MRTRISEQAGLTIVEALIAAAVLLFAMMAGFLALESASDATKGAERQAVAASVAERETERLVDLTWSQQVMCSTPAHVSDSGPAAGVPAKDPRYYVVDPAGGQPAKFKIMADYRKPSLGVLAGTPAGGEELVTGSVSGGCVDPGPSSFSSGGVTGKVYRFVTWRDETCPPTFSGLLSGLLNNITYAVAGLITGIQNRIGTGVNAFCLASNDTKRITVAVTIDPAGGFRPRYPTWVSTIETDPSAGLIIDSNGSFSFP